MTGLARIVRGYVVPALEDVALWHERDISHSSVERFIASWRRYEQAEPDISTERLAAMVENNGRRCRSQNEAMERAGVLKQEQPQ